MKNAKRLFIAVIVIGLTFTATIAFAQTAKEALYGLKKLQARCQSGIAHRDYSEAVANAKFPVNLFMESEEAKSYPEIKDSINKVMDHYEFASRVWDYMFAFRTITRSIDGESEFGREITSLYPNATRTSFFGHIMYDIDSLLITIWKEASSELDNTTKLYAQIENDKANRIDKLKEEKDKANEIDKLKKENELLKANAEIEKLKEENTNLKKQLEALKAGKKSKKKK